MFSLSLNTNTGMFVSKKKVKCMQALHPYMGIIYVLVKCQRRLPPVRGSLGLDVQSLAYLFDLLPKDMRGIKNGDVPEPFLM